MKGRSWLVVAGITLFGQASYGAEVTATLTGASDYISYGLSQTDSRPALQGSIDWASPQGFYASLWTSNISNLGPSGTSAGMEWDLSGGYGGNITESIAYTAGLGYYTYHGGGNGVGKASDGNYGEILGSLIFNKATTLSLNYAWDYAGTDAKHYILKVGHTIPVGDYSLQFSVDRSTSLDDNKFTWFGDDSYVHWSAGVSRPIQGINFGLSIEGTDIDDNNDPNNVADTVLLFKVSKTFDLF